ncbi:MAG: ATP-dependent RNA helicase DbpA [Thermoanaerobaculia bacterium]|nr:ATP-dependent RNA helicase DbpA [Thermoanaerobaculia bacterium]
MTVDFASLRLSPSLLAVVAELGYQAPTPIQVACIPLLLAGKDVIGQSKTGSGKTAAFALPILQGLELERRSLQALVLCPTRELAAQVAREFRRFGRKHSGLVVVELTGGQVSRHQVKALEGGVHIAVCTPGRLLDHLKRRTIDCSRLTTIVLDEADRMLDMGFGPNVEAIFMRLPKLLQTALFSATFPSTIQEMSQAYQLHPHRLTIDEPEQVERQGEKAPSLRQLVVESEPEDKLNALYWILGQFPHESALIFCNFKSSVTKLVKDLSIAGFSVDRLDGDLEQFQRDQVLARFRNGSLRLLVATDVAGRGLDVLDLELVVNYELPGTPEIYVHRIGRTGRAGRSGVAVSLARHRELSRIEAIEQLTGESVERVPSEALEPNPKKLIRKAKMLTLLISGGRKDKLRPGDILGALTGDAGGISGDNVGKIEIQDRLTYVAVARGAATQAVERLNDGRIKGRRFRATLIA